MLRRQSKNMMLQMLLAMASVGSFNFKNSDKIMDLRLP